MYVCLVKIDYINLKKFSNNSNDFQGGVKKVLLFTPFRFSTFYYKKLMIKLTRSLVTVAPCFAVSAFTATAVIRQ